MISYKRDVLERQSLSEAKMGWGSPICERVCNKIVEHFKNNIPQHQTAKALQISSSTVHKSSKDSENLEKSLCVRDRAEDLCWMPVVFGPSDDTASLIGMILSLTSLNGPRNTSRNRVICRCQLKLYHAKMKPYVNMVQKRLRVLWVEAY